MTNTKVDKGFEIFYSKLSYRRKFIRTLWTTPFFILLLVHMFLTDDSVILSIIVSIVLIVIYFIQLVYTYSKWKKEE